MVHKAGDWGSKLRQLLYRYDSVALTFLEGGIEYVIYDPKRVISLKVHQVLHTSISSGGISTESSSSSFRISTATDPGYGSGSCSSSGGSSDAGSSGSSVSGDSSDGGAESPALQPKAVCSPQLGSRLRHYAGSPCQPDTSSCSSCTCSTDGSQPDASAASKLSMAAVIASQMTDCHCQGCSQVQHRSTCQQEGQQRDPAAHQPHRLHAQRQQQRFDVQQEGCEHASQMVVLLPDSQPASCSKQMAASNPADRHMHLVGVRGLV